MLKVGDSASVTKSFTQEDVVSFANLTGDQNPIHINEKYAAKSRFKKPIVHGILVSGLISSVLGMQMPGPGSIYIKQTLNFRAPVFIGDHITATATIENIRSDKPIATVKTVCTNQNDVVVLDGEALLLISK